MFRQPICAMLRTCIVTTSIVLLIACQPNNIAESTPAYSAADPEAATGFREQHAVVMNDYMVVTANPYAAEAGARILAQGGNAMDAAVAVQAMLTLVEPQSSGIGGGGFLLYWDADEKQLYSLDARETAPASVKPDIFLDDQGAPIRWIDAVVGGRSVGVPGIVMGLEVAHQRFGQKDWASLFADTIARAEQGFVVSPRLAQLVAMEMNPGLRQLSVAKQFFYPNEEPIAAGDLLRNPALAASLQRIAEEGAAGFYEGPLAQAMVNAVQNAERAPGSLTLEDLSQYQVKWREPLCGPYRGYRICSMDQPSSGGLALLQTLGILEHFDLGNDPDSVSANHYFTQASRLAFADRNYYSADADFVEVPVEALLQPDYLAQRAALIGDEDMGSAQAGTPNTWVGLIDWFSDGRSYEQPNTTHFSIIDRNGNIVSLTSSIEMGFGSAIMVEGFLLNNQLTDFSFTPMRQDKPVANRVEPGKRPRSSMTPVVIFDADGKPVHALGSPGGPRIINYVTRTVIGLIDWQLDMQSAIHLPHITNLNSSTAIEAERAPEHWQRAFEARGHNIEIRPLNSGLHGISIAVDGRLIGGADPRREGKVSGQ